MIPPKLSVFTYIGKNFAATLQFEDLSINNFFLFVKNLELVSNAFLLNVEKKTKTFCRKNS